MYFVNIKIYLHVFSLSIHYIYIHTYINTYIHTHIHSVYMITFLEVRVHSVILMLEMEGIKQERGSILEA